MGGDGMCGCGSVRLPLSTSEINVKTSGDMHKSKCL